MRLSIVLWFVMVSEQFEQNFQNMGGGSRVEGDFFGRFDHRYKMETEVHWVRVETSCNQGSCLRTI